MADLSNLKRQRVITPPIITVYSPEGFGKSTLVGRTKDAICLACEDPGPVDVTYYPTARHAKPTMEEIRECLKDLKTQDHPYKTFAIDTLTSLEQTIHEFVANEAGAKSVSDQKLLGFQEGYKRSFNIFKEIFEDIMYLKNNKGMTVLLLGHATTSTITPPNSESYNVNTISLHQGKGTSVAEYVFQRSDCVFFIDDIPYSKNEEMGFDKKRTIVTGYKRVAFTRRRPTTHAKNRYDMKDEIPFDDNAWDVWMKQIHAFFKTRSATEQEGIKSKTAA